MDILKLIKDFENIKPRMEEFLNIIEKRLESYDARFDRMEKQLQELTDRLVKEAEDTV